MNIFVSDRRLARRHRLAISLQFWILKSGMPEESATSLNLSFCGVYFATRFPLCQGEAVQVVLKMPKLITLRPAIKWCCTGHVVRVHPICFPEDVLGVGVTFDCYEILHLHPPFVPLL